MMAQNEQTTEEHSTLVDRTGVVGGTWPSGGGGMQSM